jgi:acylpyruvate hydrolase
MGKNFDATGGFGPDLVTPDELPAGASGLRIVARLNGQAMQDSNTADMIFDVATLVATLSEAMTLEPGDVIATGTPSGVGYARNPPVFMKPGDVSEIEIEGIGILANTIARRGPIAA